MTFIKKCTGSIRYDFKMENWCFGDWKQNNIYGTWKLGFFAFFLLYFRVIRSISKWLNESTIDYRILHHRKKHSITQTIMTG